MNKQQAFGIIQQVCQNYVGTIEEHNTVGQAMQIIQTELFPVEKEKPTKVKEAKK